MLRNLLLLLMMLGLTRVVAAAAISPEEKQKQDEFKKAMSSAERIDHVKAIALLEGAVHPSSAELLSLVVQTSPNKEVRLAAFKMLAQMPSPDPRLAMVLVNHFKNIKPNDIDERLEFAEQMKLSEFKYPIYEALSDWGTKLRYPDLLTNYNNTNSGSAGGGNGTVGGDPNYGIKKQRAAFEKFAKVYNTVTGAKITATDREAPLQCRTWWAENKDKVLAADKELLEKRRAEELEARTRANQLGKPGEKAEKAEPVEKAEKPKAKAGPDAE